MAPKYQVQIPAYTYNTPAIDIGSGYAKGIESAGQSIAGAIKGVMGGIDPQTGEVQEGILQQNSTANDFIHQMGLMKNPDGTPVISPELRDSILSGSLGSKHKWIGLLTTSFASNLNQQNALAQERLRQQGSLATVAATGAEERKTAQVTHPDLSLAPTVVNPQSGQTDEQARAQVQAELQKRLAAMGAGPSAVAGQPGVY
jgi:hypothetical protein